MPYLSDKRHAPNYPLLLLVVLGRHDTGLESRISVGKDEVFTLNSF